MPSLLPSTLLQGARSGGPWKPTSDEAHDKTDEGIRGNEVELRLRRAAGGLQGGGRRALAVEAVDDGQLGQVAEEALREVVALCTRQ